MVDVLESRGASLGDAAKAPRAPLDTAPDAMREEAKARSSEFDKQNQQLTEQLNKISGDTAEKNKRLESQLELQKPPTLEKPPPYKPPKASTPAEEWGSWAMAFAMLGSLFTRRPMMTAMNAGASVLNAFKAGDAAAAEQSFKQWEVANKNAFELANFQQKAYDDIVKNYERRESINTTAGAAQERAVQAQINALAHSFQDKTLLALGTERNTQAQINEIDRRAKEIEHGKEVSAKVQKFHEEAQQRAKDHQIVQSPEFQAALQSGDALKQAQLLAAGGNPKAIEHLEKIEEQRKTAEAKTGGVDKAKTVDEIVEGIDKGTIPPDLKGLYGLGGPVRAKLEEKGVDLTKRQLEWASAQAQMRTANSVQQTKFVTIANSVTNTIDEVHRLAEEMKLSGVPALNKARLATYIQAEGNSEKGQLAASYIGAVNTLKSEFANLENGGYAPTESTWTLANEQVNGDYGVKELGASLNEIKRLINFRIAAVPNLKEFGPGSANRYTGSTGQHGVEDAAPGAGAVAPKPGAPADFKPTRTLNGRPIGVVGGKWVFDDGSPAQ